MKRIRPIEIEKCCICGEKFDKLTMHKIFTGRVKYECNACKTRGERQIAAKSRDWRATARGKAVISELEKHK
jgi:hypothetical protein